MDGKQGKRLSPLTIDRIKTLLAFTDMTIPEIAERMGCTRGRVLVQKIQRQGILHLTA
jgi:hypothetical protein